MLTPHHQSSTTYALKNGFHREHVNACTAGKQREHDCSRSGINSANMEEYVTWKEGKVLLVLLIVDPQLISHWLDASCRIFAVESCTPQPLQVPWLKTLRRVVDPLGSATDRCRSRTASSPQTQRAAAAGGARGSEPALCAPQVISLQDWELTSFYVETQRSSRWGSKGSATALCAPLQVISLQRLQGDPQGGLAISLRQTGLGHFSVGQVGRPPSFPSVSVYPRYTWCPSPTAY